MQSFQESTETYQNRINELTKENAVLQAKIPTLQQENSVLQV